MKYLQANIDNLQRRNLFTRKEIYNQLFSQLDIMHKELSVNFYSKLYNPLQRQLNDGVYNSL